MTYIETLIVAPFKEMVFKIASFIPTLLGVILILVIGLLVAKLFHTVLLKLFKEIQLDKLSDKVGLTELLDKGGIKNSLSDILVGLVYLIVIISFVIMAVEMMGVSDMYLVLTNLVSYIPAVVSSVLALVFGLILAKIVSTVLFAVAMNLSMPHPKLYEIISRWAIMIYAFSIALKHLGFGYLFEGTTFHILFAGLVFAISLAFGLGGKDAAAKYLDKKGK